MRGTGPLHVHTYVYTHVYTLQVEVAIGTSWKAVFDLYSAVLDLAFKFLWTLILVWLAECVRKCTEACMQHAGIQRGMLGGGRMEPIYY